MTGVRFQFVRDVIHWENIITQSTDCLFQETVGSLVIEAAQTFSTAAHTIVMGLSGTELMPELVPVERTWRKEAGGLRFGFSLWIKTSTVSPTLNVSEEYTIASFINLNLRIAINASWAMCNSSSIGIDILSTLAGFENVIATFHVDNLSKQNGLLEILIVQTE